jgi:hypothetical protein
MFLWTLLSLMSFYYSSTYPSFLFLLFFYRCLFYWDFLPFIMHVPESYCFPLFFVVFLCVFPIFFLSFLSLFCPLLLHVIRLICIYSQLYLLLLLLLLQIILACFPASLPGVTCAQVTKHNSFCPTNVEQAPHTNQPYQQTSEIPYLNNSMKGHFWTNGNYAKPPHNRAH